VLLSVVLGATVFREQVAWAAQAVDATIIGPLDSNGNVKVHEQGTAAVNVTNRVSIAPESPITNGGGRRSIPSGLNQLETVTATALSIHLTMGVDSLDFSYQGHLVAAFFGPHSFGNPASTSHSRARSCSTEPVAVAS
jgi:hypothetical protein